MSRLWMILAAVPLPLASADVGRPLNEKCVAGVLCGGKTKLVATAFSAAGNCPRRTEGYRAWAYWRTGWHANSLGFVGTKRKLNAKYWARLLMKLDRLRFDGLSGGFVGSSSDTPSEVVLHESGVATFLPLGRVKLNCCVLASVRNISHAARKNRIQPVCLRVGVFTRVATPNATSGQNSLKAVHKSRTAR